MNKAKHPLDINKMTRSQLNEELEKGYREMQKGSTNDIKESFMEIRKDYNI